MDKKIHQKLLIWYEKHQRTLPWRGSTDPYAIWISEAMLQQTQVDTVIPYFNRWIKNYPTLQKLSLATLDEILHLWSGLGYYTRARNIYNGARYIKDHYQSKIPNDYQSLRKIPGIGDYSASAIISIAFNQNYPALDGNAKRVYSRLFATNDQSLIREKAQNIITLGKSGDFNQAIMDLGSSICLPRNLQCQLCPLSSQCKAKEENQQDLYPQKIKSKPLRKITTVCVLIEKNKKYLIRQRPSKGLLAGLWEFPSFQIKTDENPKKQLQQILSRQFSHRISVGTLIGSFNHIYTHLNETLYAYQGIPEGIFSKPRSKAWKWIALDEADTLAWPGVQKKIILALHAYPKKPR